MVHTLGAHNGPLKHCAAAYGGPDLLIYWWSVIVRPPSSSDLQRFFTWANRKIVLDLLGSNCRGKWIKIYVFASFFMCQHVLFFARVPFFCFFEQTAVLRLSKLRLSVASPLPIAITHPRYYTLYIYPCISGDVCLACLLSVASIVLALTAIWFGNSGYSPSNANLFARV